MALNIVEKIDGAVNVKHVLASVSDKRGLDCLVPGLVAANPDVKIYSTGGTYAAIETLLGPEAAARNLVAVAAYTGQPEMQGGLVKTLDFKIYLGLLSETYNEAFRLAPRGNPEKEWQIRILHRMADLDVQRLDWSAAIKDNEEILRISPDDERAHLALFRLYPRTGHSHLSIGALDKLIRRYLTNDKTAKALTVLEDLIESQPDSIPLRARIAQLCLNLGKRDQALQHLDILGDLQLEAGHREGAIKTIEAILALNPPNEAVYADLYREMAQREPPARKP